MSGSRSRRKRRAPTFRFKATCAHCLKETLLPFNPERSTRLPYCQDCYRSQVLSQQLRNPGVPWGNRIRKAERQLQRNADRLNQDKPRETLTRTPTQKQLPSFGAYTWR